jgi:hypothetical protein
MFKQLVQGINAGQGLDRIMAPLEGKVAELNEYAAVCLKKAEAIRTDTHALIEKARDHELSAAAAKHYAEQLEAIFNA